MTVSEQFWWLTPFISFLSLIHRATKDDVRDVAQLALCGLTTRKQTDAA